jgi:hypothetical protein
LYGPTKMWCDAWCKPAPYKHIVKLLDKATGWWNWNQEYRAALATPAHPTRSLTKETH